MRHLILLNGVPASGKSTVAKAMLPVLAAAGAAPVPLALDTVKEGLFAQIGTGDRAYNRMLGRASYHAIFNSIASFPDGLLPMVDAWHGFQPLSVLQGHLALARIDKVVEVWCSVRPETAAARYRARSSKRSAGHLPGSYADELFTLTQTAQPLGLGPVIKIDTEAALPRKAWDPLMKELGLDAR